MEEVPDSWDMLEKVGEVQHSWVKDKAVMKNNSALVQAHNSVLDFRHENL